MSARFDSFREFYPFYLSEHRKASRATGIMYWQLLTGKLSFEERDPRAGEGPDPA